MNALVQPANPFTKVHVFRVFAHNEFKLWYDYPYKKLFQEFNTHKVNKTIYSYPKEGAFIKKSALGLIFGDDFTSIEIRNKENLDEVSFNSRLGGFIFEHTVSKWIKNNFVLVG